MRFVLCLLLSACYSPPIKDGQFTCAFTALCPSGMSCQEGRCVRPDDGFDLGIFVDIYSGKLGDLDLTGRSGTLSVNTETGQWLLDGTEVLAPSTPGWKRVPQPGGPMASVFPFRGVNIPSTVKVVAAPTTVPSALVLSAQHSIQLDGTLDWTGLGSPGAELREMRGHDLSGGTSGGLTGAMSTSGGGGGGGYGGAGLVGGGTGGGGGGNPFGNGQLQPLQVGAGGGGGAGISAIDFNGRGGRGGGAVALLVVGEILLGGTIDVSGGKGQDVNTLYQANGGGGGGGSGGSILLSAAQGITFGAGHKLIAKGGTGGMPTVAGGVGGVGGVGRIFVATPKPSYAVGLSPMSEPQAVVGTDWLVSFPQ